MKNAMGYYIGKYI